MKVVLDTADIESLIKDFYKNVDEIAFEPKEVKVTLKISGLKPINQVINSPPPILPKKLSPEDKLITEAKEKVMASGGKARLLSRV